jgi:diphthine synthase
LLYIIGIGISEFDSLPIGSVDILKNSDFVFIERFTGFISDDFFVRIKNVLDDSIEPQSKTVVDIRFVKRWYIEDGREILEKAAFNNVSILAYGDPLVATTYNELMIRAKRLSIDVKVIHSSSGLISLIGETGLQPYKFGKMVTMMNDPMSSISVYNTIYDNLSLGLHTLILTEYNNDDGIANFDSSSNPFYLSPKKVFDLLLKREGEIKLANLSAKTFAIVARQIGSVNSQILSGNIDSLSKLDYEGGPNSVIIPGSLHFIEEDSLRTLTRLFDPPSGNSSRISRMANRMLDKYIPNAKIALANLIDLLRATPEGLPKEFASVLENAENYLNDAQTFYNHGKLELAILSIGYAEGLIDSIRFQKNMNPW